MLDDPNPSLAEHKARFLAGLDQTVERAGAAVKATEKRLAKIIDARARLSRKQFR